MFRKIYRRETPRFLIKMILITALAIGLALLQGCETVFVSKAFDNKYKTELTDEQYYIMVRGGTERPFSSPLNNEKRSGVYVSAATGDILFDSNDKFNSRTGWPSFDSATNNVALGPAEQGGYEVIEKSTGLHLGHLFIGEGFTDKNKRYCINGDALIFIPNL